MIIIPGFLYSVKLVSHDFLRQFAKIRCCHRKKCNMTCYCERFSAYLEERQHNACFSFEFKNLQRCCLHLCQVGEYNTFRVDLPETKSFGRLGESQSLYFGGKTGGWPGTELLLRKIGQCDMPWLVLDFIQRHRVAGESWSMWHAWSYCQRKSFSVTQALGCDFDF